MASALEKCIYCGADGSDFPREHVIPEALGHFKGALTIWCVCGDCNHYFSRELELEFFRDSGEALLRFLYGIKPAAKALQLGTDRVSLRSAMPGDFYNCHLQLQPSDNGAELIAVPVPQVGCKLPLETNWSWLLEENLNYDILGPYRRPDAQLRVVGRSNEDIARIQQALATFGIEYRQGGVLDQPYAIDGRFQIIGRFEMDEVIFRAVAKIALNYLAHELGAEFARRSDFDAIRKFVHEGVGDSRNFVQVSRRRILTEDSRHYPLTRGHVITLDWNLAETGLLVSLSLFSRTTYTVCLTRHFSGLWRLLQTGHHFDIESLEVSELQSAKLVQPVRLRVHG